MDSVSTQPKQPSVAPIEGFPPHAAGAAASGPRDGQRDTFEMDSVRLYLRDLCNAGQALDHIYEIIESGIEPDGLRAELAFRASLGEGPAATIILNYLSGNFKQALSLTNELADDENAAKQAEFIFFADYFAGRFDKACEEAKNLPALDFSPFFCYTYADMLLSLGYLDEAVAYNKRYVMLARKYLRNFVSEKERYDDEKKRREGGRRQNPDGEAAAGENLDGQKKSAEEKSAQILGQNDIFRPAVSGVLKALLDRRRQLMEVLKTRNVSIDKRPLMYEFMDVDAKIEGLTHSGA